jgi:hypothetical protein
VKGVEKYNQLARQMEWLENYRDANFDKADHSPVLCISPFYSDLCKSSKRLSLCGPGEALRVQKAEASRIHRQSAQEVGKIVSPKHRPPLPLGVTLVLISVRG